MTRKTIPSTLYDIHWKLDDMTLIEAIEYLVGLMSELGPQAKIDSDPGYDGGVKLHVRYERLETDAEYEERIKEEADVARQEQDALNTRIEAVKKRIQENLD